MTGCPTCSGRTACGCTGCRSDRVATDRLARLAIRDLDRPSPAFASAESEEADLRAGTMALPGGAIAWSGPVPLPRGDAATILRSLDGRRGPVPPLLQTPAKSLYAIAVGGLPVYVGMVPASTVVARIRAHIRLAAAPPASRRGDLARLAPIMRDALARRSRIDVWAGRITDWGPYSRDNKALHAFEILAANLLLSRRRLPVGYDRNTWTFEEERLLEAEES